MVRLPGAVNSRPPPAAAGFTHIDTVAGPVRLNPVGSPMPAWPSKRADWPIRPFALRAAPAEPTTLLPLASCGAPASAKCQTTALPENTPLASPAGVAFSLP
jgi:hypothetical protein